KTRILNYGTRLLYDVVVPEPAAFLIDSLKKAAQPENFQLTRPPEPTIWPPIGRPRRFLPSDLNASNYMYWAALYGGTGSVTPPPEDFVLTVAHTDTDRGALGTPIQAYGGTFYGSVFQAFPIRVPDNYKAISGYVQFTNPSFAGPIDTWFEFFIGDNY